LSGLDRSFYYYLGHYDACFKTVHYLSLSPTDDGRCTAYSAPPGPLAVFKGPTSKVKKGEGEESREREGEGKGREGSGRTTLHTPCRKILATRHCSQLYERTTCALHALYDRWK